MATKRKVLDLSDDEAPPNGNPSSLPPIIHKSEACLDKASSNTPAGVGVSRKVAPWISSLQTCLDEQPKYISSAPPASSSTLPPDDLPSPHAAIEAVQPAEPIVTDVSLPAAINLSRSSSRTSFAQADDPTIPIQAAINSTATSINSQRLPLTKQNLRIFTGAAMADNPVTPSRSAGNTGPGTMNSQKATNTRGVHMVLTANGMPMEDPDIKVLHPRVHQFATEIVNAERNSPVRPGWKENFSQQRDQYATRNENTWIRKIWDALQNPERNVRKKDGEGSVLDQESWEAVAWNKSGLDDNWDQLLHTGSLPRPETKYANEAALIESLPKVSTPKPDIAFGLSAKLFNKVEMVVNERYHMYAQVSEGIYHPWFLVETKTNGTIEEVEIQCCRGGAAFVCCARQLIEDSDPEAFAAKHGPDLESMAFSLALVPTCAQIYYHWANRDEDRRIIYHTHFLKSFVLRDEDACERLLHVVNNILDWGLNARLISVKSTLDKIHSLTEEQGPKKRKRANSI